VRTAIRRGVAAGLAAATVGFATAPIHAAQSSEAFCRDVTVSVGLLGLESMFGQLCVPQTPTNTVLVLVPGGTYTNTYWDLPSSAGLHSFRTSMNNAGYATLAIDRLGTGRSSKPLSATVTAITQAAAIHQVIGQLRAGRLGTRFGKVIIGGHSIGSAVTLIEAATYRDVNGVLLTGISHYPDLVDTAANVLTALIPAPLDPNLVRRGLDPGYLTTRVGARERAFHWPGAPPPAVMNWDEATKDAFSALEVVDGLGVAVLTPESLLINAPTLIVLSSGDEIFCGPLATNCSSSEALRAQEAPHFTAAAQLETKIFPGGYGHCFNFAPNAREFPPVVADWADRKVGR
jgi:pimeloyl-ACP methyl ester carboxylesterase